MEITKENCEMIWKIWKKGKLKCEKILKIWKKSKLNSDKIWTKNDIQLDPSDYSQL
jgi:hypothetical protein